MPESTLTPYNLNDRDSLFKFGRYSWLTAGTDNFTKPPVQNPDMLEVLNNLMPPVNGVFLRRWGYREFQPKLDSGASITDDSK